MAEEGIVKYAVPNELATKLLALGLCETEEDAIEKVASGEAQEMIKQAEAADE